MSPPVEVVRVFPAGPGGGNPAPVVVDADGMSDAEMQAVARAHGHESGFVRSAPSGSGCDFALRFWVPNHEMSMCGHATVGATWLLDRLGLIPREEVRFLTRSGPVTARVSGPADARRAAITQPIGSLDPVDDHLAPAILEVLGITAAELAPRSIRNASTSRVKTLVPLADVSVLDGLRPDFTRMKGLCDRLGSTGLYPYAQIDQASQVFAARQFPRASGYPEDAATGIAAAALSFSLLETELVERTERPIHVRQGRAMGRPSEMELRFVVDEGDVSGLWLGGSVEL